MRKFRGIAPAAIVGASLATAVASPALAGVPVEYVKVCETYGAGFYYIPGTDTCIRLGGRVRTDFSSVPNGARVEQQPAPFGFKPSNNEEDAFCRQQGHQFYLPGTTQCITLSNGRASTRSYADLRGLTNGVATPHSGGLSGDATLIGGILLGDINISGGANYDFVPRINAGTQFNGVTEVPITTTDSRLTGSSFSGGATFNLNLGIFNRARVDLRYAEADGSSNGFVPIGGNNVAHTNLFPTSSGSTGVAAGATGQSVATKTEVDAFEASMMLKTRPLLTNLFAQPQNGVATQVYAGVGALYGYYGRWDTINQQSLGFAGLNSLIHFDAESHFFAPQFGLGFGARQTGPTGFYGGAFGYVAPGVLFTDASASLRGMCVPCGAASTQFELFQRVDRDGSDFAVKAGINAWVGYRFTPSVHASLNLNYAHMSRSPVGNIPTTPNQQGQDILRFGSQDSLDFRARVSYSPGPPP